MHNIVGVDLCGSTPDVTIFQEIIMKEGGKIEVLEEYTGPSCSPSCEPEIGDVAWGEPSPHWRLKLAVRWAQFVVLTFVLILVLEVPVYFTTNFLGVKYEGPILSMALAAVVRDGAVALVLLWLWWGINRLRA